MRDDEMQYMTDLLDADDTARGRVQDHAEPTDLIMYVQVRTRWATVSNCQAQIALLQRSHPDAKVTIEGLSKDSRYLRITLGINLGDSKSIATRQGPSAESVAAYAFTSDLFTSLFEHLPQYTPEPTTAERAAAAALLRAQSEKDRTSLPSFVAAAKAAYAAA